MACKYTYKGITYNSKEEFISQIINPRFLSNQKIRRVMEVQSDLFQKGRDKQLLVKENYSNDEIFKSEEFKNAEEDDILNVELSNNRVIKIQKTSNVGFKDLNFTNNINANNNQFLQLLNKDNNWVTFFVKSIIQDSAKKGYEKILFPSGNTASKVEGHTTLEEFKKQKEDRIKELKKKKEDIGNNPQKYIESNPRHKRITEELEKLDKDQIPETFLYYSDFNGLFDKKESIFSHNGELVVWEDVKHDEYRDKISKGEAENQHGVKFLVLKDSIQKEIIKENTEKLRKELLTISTENDLRDVNNEIDQYKQEIEDIETEGFGALRPIYNFYENTVTNILNKTYGKENVKQITDEYGNTWNEITLNNEKIDSNILLQLNTKTILEPAIQELDAYLLKFMKSFGVNSKQFDDLKSKIGVDALGATDVLNKLIWYTKNRNVETVPEEVGHMAVMLMGEKHPDINELLNNIENWSEYQDVYDAYMPIYGDVEKVKIEAIGKLLAKSLVSNYGKTGIDKSLVEKALNALKAFIEKILSGEKISHIYAYNENIADKIALNVLSGNKDYIRKITNVNPNLDFKYELNNNPLARDLINKFAGADVKVTGSLAISAHGENIRRPQGEGIHDLDFKVKSFDVFTNKILPQIEKLNSVPAHYGWHKKSYSTYSYLVAEEGLTIKVLERKDDFSNGWITAYELYDKNGKQVEITQKNVIGLDFFVYKEDEEEGVYDTKSLFAPGSSVYKGKLDLGGKSNPYFFSREKDQEDYVLRNPTSFTPTKNAVYYQNQESQNSAASVNTIAKVKLALEKMGVNQVELADYLKGNPGIEAKGVNGLADLAKGTIAVAQGRENVALTEEMVHMATAILEQNNPKLITEMISKIGNYKIYKETYDTYSKLKSYQLENGKPDIRKIKKEAVDKLIAELIIHNSEGSTQFPELLEENNRNMVQRWWDNIMESIRTLFGTTEVDLFNETAKQIIGEELIGTISDINTEGVYLQQDNNKNVIGNNSVVDTYFDIIDGEAAKMNFYEKDELATNPKRHYTYDGVDVEYSVTEYLDKGKKPLNRTEEQVAEDNMKKEWGSEGHRYLEEHLKANLIDSNGFRRSFPGVTPITSTLEDSVVEKIEAFAEELINSYPEGTRFLVEKMVVNKKVKGMRASKIDFIALVPVENKKGEKDIKVDILDWKFTSIDKRRQEDIHTSKMKEWIPQMGEYVNIMYNYGVSRNQLGKNRMIPLIMNYDSVVPGMASQGVYASSIEIGNVDSTKETTLYLLPVPTPSESTGNIKVDELVASLKQQWEKVYKTPGKPEDKLKKDLNLNFLAKAIRFLHVKHDFGPLSRVGVNFLEDAEKVLEDFENIDYSKLGVDEINAKLDTILTLRNTAEKYISIDEVFISKYPKDTLDAEQNEVLTKLSRVAKSTERMLTKIDNVQTEFAIQLAVKKGMNLNTYEDAEGNTRIAAEKEITGLVKSFSEGTKLPAKLIKLATGLIMQSKNVVDIIFNRQSKEYSKILADLEKVAQSKGTTAFDMIATMDEKGLKLIKKLDSKFYKDVEKAIKDKDKKFFIDNMDLDAYNALVDEKLAKDYAILDKTKFVEDEEENNMIIAYRKKLLKDSLDISSKSFDGYNTYMFKVFFAQTRKEEKHYSPAYKKMAAIPEALAVWEFFTELNKKAKDMGYLDKEGSSFFPLMEATTLQKFAQTDNPLAQGKDFFADLYSVNINEQQNYSKIDPETGKLKKVVPTYFKKTDKNINQLSKDLNKVGLVWMKTLMDYQSTKELEFTLLTLQEVEKSKGSLMVDEKGDIIFKHGVAQINEKQNKNAELFETIINDAVYKIKQDLGSIGNKQISSAAKKATSDTEDLEAVESKEFVIKKALNNADTLVRALAVGLKPMITAANYFGNNLHAFIQAGNFYKYREFFNNNKKLMASMSVEEKALLHLTAPFTDNLLTEKIREGATSVKSYLSTWSFSDVMMITNSFPERKLQYANAMSFNDNAMIVDGKIVNIRQYLRAKDRETKYAKDSSGKYLMSEEERKKLEDSFQERVDALKESSNIYKSVKIDETTGDISLEGVTDEELAKYRIAITEYGRTLSGQMSEENKANFKRDALLTSFMMFKTWIPKLLTGRIQNVNKNEQSGDWEYGRTRAFLKVISYSWKDSVSNISDIIAGNENGLKIMSDILEDKRIQHFKSTGQELEITDEEFYDLMRAEIKRELRELTALSTIIGFVAAIGAAQPPEEASDLEKNHYKYLTKISSKILDELSFYYNPISLEAITRGSILPSIGLLSKLFKFGKSLGELGYGEVVGDEKMVKDAHPLKYFLNMVPGGYQIMTEIVPFVWPETAKEMGVRVTGESRQK